MLAVSKVSPLLRDEVARRRSIALDNVRWFRAMARRALRDGSPKAQLRAANARAAARIVLQHAKLERVSNP